MNDQSEHRKIKREASARRTHRTTFRLRQNDHRLIQLLADAYHLTEKDFLDTIVRADSQGSWKDLMSEELVGSDLPQGVRKTYVVTSKVIAGLDAGAKAAGCSRDMYLTILAQLIGGSLRRETREEIDRYKKSISMLETALNREFCAAIEEAHRLTEDMDWQDGYEPQTVLSMFTDCTIAQIENEITRCQQLEEQLTEALETTAQEVEPEGLTVREEGNSARTPSQSKWFGAKER